MCVCVESTDQGRSTNRKRVDAPRGIRVRISFEMYYVGRSRTREFKRISSSCSAPRVRATDRVNNYSNLSAVFHRLEPTYKSNVVLFHLYRMLKKASVHWQVTRHLRLRLGKCSELFDLTTTIIFLESLKPFLHNGH